MTTSHKYTNIPGPNFSKQLFRNKRKLTPKVKIKTSSEEVILYEREHYKSLIANGKYNINHYIIILYN